MIGKVISETYFLKDGNCSLPEDNSTFAEEIISKNREIKAEQIEQIVKASSPPPAESSN